MTMCFVWMISLKPLNLSQLNLVWWCIIIQNAIKMMGLLLVKVKATWFSSPLPLPKKREN